MVSKKAKIVDVMIDIETLGTAPGAVILSIGAAAEAPETEYRAACERRILIASSLYAGFKIDEDTLAWWRRQDAIAWANSTDGTESVHNALRAFSFWLEDQRGRGEALRVWGDGSAFDMVLMETAYRMVGLPVPWKYGEVHCYRTLRQILGSKKPDLPAGKKHTALADAGAQMAHLQELLRVVDNADKRPGVCTFIAERVIDKK